MMRSAKWVASAISDPPKPRLRTICCGKSSASVFHIRMVEEPMKRIPPLVGGLARSAASYAAISASHREKSCAGAGVFSEGRCPAWVAGGDCASNHDGAKSRVEAKAMTAAMEQIFDCVTSSSLEVGLRPGVGSMPYSSGRSMMDRLPGRGPARGPLRARPPFTQGLALSHGMARGSRIEPRGKLAPRQAHAPLAGPDA